MTKLGNSKKSARLFDNLPLLFQLEVKPIYRAIISVKRKKKKKKIAPKEEQKHRNHPKTFQRKGMIKMADLPN